MVLHKRKAIQLEPLIHEPSLADTPDRQVWQIPETREVFVHYEDYLQRIAFLNSRTFTCEITGRSGLTYGDAKNSELLEAQEIDAHFPEALKEPVLRKAHGSPIARLDSLVDVIFDAFKTEYFPGEKVAALVGDFKETALVREKTKVVEMVFPDGFHRPASARYTIEILDVPEDEHFDPIITVDESALFRERGIFTKAILRTFLKNTLRRDTKAGAPWKAKTMYADRYRIASVDDDVKISLNSKSKKTNGTANVADHEEEKAALPIKLADGTTAKLEDLNLATQNKRRPRLARNLPVDPPMVSQFLEIWSFFNVFLEVLILDSFTLDDLGDALQSEYRCELVDELFCCLLKTIGEDKTRVSTAKHEHETEIVVPTYDYMHVEETDPVVGDILKLVPSWKTDLDKQALHSDNYIPVLLGLLCDLCRSPGKAHLRELVVALRPEDDDMESLPHSFRALPAQLKVRILTALIDMVWQTKLVRQYIDECMDHLTALRKERADATRDRKNKTDAIYQLRLKMRAQFPRAGTVATTAIKEEPSKNRTLEDSQSAKLESSDVEFDHEDDSAAEQQLSSGKRRRVSSRLVKHAKHVVSEPDTESQDDFVQGDINRVYHSRDDYEYEISKIQKSVAKADVRIQKIDEEFRESDAQRLRSLGQDRYYNTYWWLESCGMPVFGLPNCSTSHAMFATGRLFVQGPSPVAQMELEQRSVLHEYDYSKRRQVEEGEDVLDANSWGYYEDEEQIAALLEWLDARGQRESKLKAAIEARGRTIAQTMANRMRYLTEELAPERRATRNSDVMERQTRFQRWKNTMARNTLGEPHSGEIAVKGVAISKRRKR